ncbi:MAG: hypothetical protein LBG11_04785 [Bifidobacteriaceae bacterium]|nr:hypothetical protein [Bifidobacteriaceae bacterium]
MVEFSYKKTNPLPEVKESMPAVPSRKTAGTVINVAYGIETATAQLVLSPVL